MTVSSQQFIWRAISISDHGFEPTGYVAGDLYPNEASSQQVMLPVIIIPDRGFMPYVSFYM
jgi:hypothetical protein